MRVGRRFWLLGIALFLVCTERAFLSPLRFLHAVHGEASRSVDDAAAEVEEVFHRAVSFLLHFSITCLSGCLANDALHRVLRLRGLWR